MDLSAYDVTDHPAIGPGDWLELIGPRRPPDVVAAAAGTNGYEMLTSLGRRFHRVYRRRERDCSTGSPRSAAGPSRRAGSPARWRCSRSPGSRTCCARRSISAHFLRAFVEFGYFSLPVVALTAMFTGMVLALQSSTGLSRFSAESAMPTWSCSRSRASWGRCWPG